jgi:lipoprotein-releasing system ATP-binding protein
MRILLPCRVPEMIDLGMAVGSAAERAEKKKEIPPAPLLRVENLRKEYRTGRGNLLLFSGLDFTVEAGEMLAVVGQSGAGKSTLLHILGALDTPTSGDVYFDATPLSSLTSTQSSDFRNREIGYVWQFHYLLPEFTAVENVALPLLARGESKKKALAESSNWLEEVGLADRAEHRAGELSGGEQQRISLARALVTGPRLLLADEPTGDLDGKNAEAMFDLIREVHQRRGLTSILVTHNNDLAAKCVRTVRLEAGKLQEEKMSASVMGSKHTPALFGGVES